MYRELWRQNTYIIQREDILSILPSNSEYHRSCAREFDHVPAHKRDHNDTKYRVYHYDPVAFFPTQNEYTLADFWRHNCYKDEKRRLCCKNLKDNLDIVN